MPKDSVPDIVIPETPFNMTIVYIALALCVIVVSAYFMYRVYKKVETLNTDFIKINEKSDVLDKVVTDTTSFMTDIRQNMETQRVAAAHRDESTRLSMEAAHTAMINSVAQAQAEAEYGAPRETPALDDITE